MGLGSGGSGLRVFSTAYVSRVDESNIVLAAGDTYYGDIVTARVGGQVVGKATSDQAGTVKVQQGASTGSLSDLASASVSAGGTGSVWGTLTQQYARVVYVNGATGQGSFDLDRLVALG